MTTFIIIALTLFAVWNILRHYGVFESSKGASQLTDAIKVDSKQRRKRSIENAKLAVYSGVCEFFRGLVLSEAAYKKHKYVIDRLEIHSDILDRNLTPEEYKGKHLLWFIVSFVGLPLMLVNLFFGAITVAGVLYYIAYIPMCMQQIADEDEIINTYFIDLYLLMYSKLKMGSRARLQPVVESYIESLRIAADPKVRKVMEKFAQFFLNNLSLYEDHVAVQELRTRYRSAMMINFCNIAAQALQGVDNADNLLTFKMDLTRRKLEVARKKAAKLQKRAEKAIMLIYVILFYFVGVGWYSKLPADFF